MIEQKSNSINEELLAQYHQLSELVLERNLSEKFVDIILDKLKTYDSVQDQISYLSKVIDEIKDESSKKTIDQEVQTFLRYAQDKKIPREFIKYVLNNLKKTKSEKAKLAYLSDVNRELEQRKEQFSVTSVEEMVDHSFSRLFSASAIVEDKIEPDINKKQKLTQKTVKLVAKLKTTHSESYFDNVWKFVVSVSKSTATDYLSTKILEAISTVPKEKWKEPPFSDVIELINNYENTSVETKELIAKLIQEQIDTWWESYVGRPHLVTFTKNGKQIEQLVQPEGGDKVLQRDGNYVFGYSVEREIQTDYWNAAIAIAYHQLRAMTQGRRELSNKGISIAPLPNRDFYTVIFEPNFSNNNEWFKLKIPKNYLEKNYKDFKTLVIGYISHYETAENDVRSGKDPNALNKLLAKESSLEGFFPRRITHPSKKEIKKLIKKGAANQLYQSTDVQESILSETDATGADLRICNEKFGDNTRLKNVQENLDYNPIGARIGSTYILGFAGNHLKQVHTNNPHIFSDGYETQGEQKLVLGNMIDELEKEDVIQEIVHYGKTEEITSRTKQKDIEKTDIHVAVIGERKHAIEEGNVIDLLFTTFDKKSPLALHFKEKYGLILTPSVILQFVIMHVLGLNQAHFLDKNDNKLAPIVTPFPPALTRILNHQIDKNPKALPEESIEKIMSGFLALQTGRSDFRDKKTGSYVIDKGRADAEVLDTISGALKKPLSFLGKIFSPTENDMLQKSVLISMLLENNQNRKLIDGIAKALGIRLREFTTAMAETYQELGAVGVCQNKSDGLRLSYRPGKRNLVQEKFGKKNPDELFTDAVTKTLFDVIKMFAIIHKQQTSN